MSGKPPVVYWDSSAFLALLKAESTHGTGVLESLQSQASSFDRGAIVLATSTVGIMEVLSANLSDDGERFEKMVRRSNFQTVTATETIARKAAHLRRHCYAGAKSLNGGSVPSLPFVLGPADAIHVASAMLIQADVLVTLDSENKSKTREMAMTDVTKYYPVPDMHPTPIQRPALGLPGTQLF